jgi:hypothetical protein
MLCSFCLLGILVFLFSGCSASTDNNPTGGPSVAPSGVTSPVGAEHEHGDEDSGESEEEGQGDQSG